MVTIIGQHEVANFAAWKKAFDADEQNRSNAGLKTVGVYTSLKNPNDVTFIFEAPGSEGVEAMLSDPAFAEKMKNAGVLCNPDIKVLISKN